MLKQTALLTSLSLVLGTWYSAYSNNEANCSPDQLQFGPWYLVLCIGNITWSNVILIRDVFARDFLSSHLSQFCGVALGVAVECGRDSRIRGRIDLWVFVPLVIVCSSVFWEFIA
jgi:hypothetical protein